MMKKTFNFIFLFVSILIIIADSTVISFAESEASYYGGDLIFEGLPDEVIEIFDELGVNSVDFESMFNVELEDIWSIIKKLITGSVESPLNSFIRIIVLIVILAVFECYIPDGEKIKNIMRLSSNLLCVFSIISPLSTAVTSAVSSITVSENFMLILVPVLASVLSVSGNPVLAGVFQIVAFTAAQVISAVAAKLFVPLVGVILSIDITSSFMPEFKLSGLSGVIKKSVTAVISFAATLFVSFLGLKGGLANVADSFARKGIKLVISSAVPVVGGALSEAYSGVLSSIILAKSTMGVFGIAAIALINLPSCIQLLFWIFALRISAGVADLFDQSGISVLLKSIASSIVLLNVIVVLVAVLYIVSTVMVIMLKAN